MNDTNANLFFEPKFVSLLKSVSSSLAAQQHQQSQQFNDTPVDIKISGTTRKSPTPLTRNNNNKNVALLQMALQQRQNPNSILPQMTLNLPPFVPMRPVYAPSGYGRQILIYDSRAYPGRRREFAYKTRFTNQSGLTTVYYRCMACRALRHRLQRVMPKEELPAVPCIAVKNETLINDPDFPEASDHFCTPLTIQESNDRLKVTFERGYKRARMKASAEDALKQSASLNNSTVSATCEINESTSNPINIDQFLWTKNNENVSCLLIEDKNGNSIEKNEKYKSVFNNNNNETNQHSDTNVCCETPTTANGIFNCFIKDESNVRIEEDGGSNESDAEVATTTASTGDESIFNESNCTNTTANTLSMNNSTRLNNCSPRKKQRLDNLLRLHKQRQLMQQQREKSISPNENLNIASFAQKLFENSEISPASFLTPFNNPISATNEQSASAFNFTGGFEGTTFGEITGNIPNLFNLSNMTSPQHNINNDHQSRLNNFSSIKSNVTAANNIYNLQQAFAARFRSSSELLKVFNSSQSMTPNTISFTSSLNSNFICDGINNNCNSMSNAHLSEILNKHITNNWDLPENAGDSRSACELTCSLILALARNVPQAAASMKKGKWLRKEFMGEEVYGKTLAIIGLGRIGQEVASRMQSFGMKVVGYDPLISAEDATKRNIQWLNLDDIWPIADYITVHVPLINQTRDLLSHAIFAKCKKGVRIVNVARGGIVNESDLHDALNSGQVGGAALDVFVEEPPTFRSLIDHPKVICTPHLGASTLEAQQRVAVEIAENIIALNAGVGLYGALNANSLAAVLDDIKTQYVKTASHLGQILASIAPSTKNITIKYPDGAEGLQKALIAAVSVSVLKANGCAGLNLLNAEVNAIKEGISVQIEKAACGVTEFTITNGQSVTVCGYPSPAGTLISSINGAKALFPILATGILAISKGNSSNIISSNEKLSTKLAGEFSLRGGPQLALFDETLSQDEIQELSTSYNVVQFDNNDNNLNINKNN